ncbi:imm11 family protein [Neobacillus sp. NPDC093182]|uniref:imm11 family protein n=1 Tax=Neobacillus sp. NPDC093182 TaxID=3364297 RepID=UPI00381E19CD
MRYYKLLLDESVQDDIVCYCEDNLGFEQYHLNEGKFIYNWDGNLTFIFNPDEGARETDYLANDLSWFIVSSNLKRLLQGLGNNEIQYLPVRVVNLRKKALITEYFVANVLGVIEALNLENSDYGVIELDDEKVYSIRKYALNQNVIRNHHIFKIKGFEIPTFVSEVFKDAVLKNEITGCDFLEVKTI